MVCLHVHVEVDPGYVLMMLFELRWVCLGSQHSLWRLVQNGRLMGQNWLEAVKLGGELNIPINLLQLLN